MGDKGFFGSLFDISFTSLVTTRVIKILYVLSLVLVGLFALAFIIGGFANSVGSGVAALIFAPLVALFYVIYARVILEVLICIFRIMQTNAELVALGRQQATHAGLTPALAGAEDIAPLEPPRHSGGSSTPPAPPQAPEKPE